MRRKFGGHRPYFRLLLEELRYVSPDFMVCVPGIQSRENCAHVALQDPTPAQPNCSLLVSSVILG